MQYLSRWLSRCLGSRAFSKNAYEWASKSGDTGPSSLLPTGSPSVGRARAGLRAPSGWGQTWGEAQRGSSLGQGRLRQGGWRIRGQTQNGASSEREEAGGLKSEKGGR